LEIKGEIYDYRKEQYNMVVKQQEKDYKRRFDTVEAGGWMMWNIDDLMYGYLKLIATYNPNTKELYFTKKTWNKTSTKQAIKKICGIERKRDRDAHFDKLINAGLLELRDKDTENARYVFQDSEKNFKLVPLDLLEYLLNTASVGVIQVYIYLLDKYEWKKKTGGEYYFTKREIALALGYSESSAGGGTISARISDIIGCLVRQRIIQFEQVAAVTFYNKTPTIRQKLTFVAKSIDELIPVDVK
jgi:hypothetical protein